MYSSGKEKEEGGKNISRNMDKRTSLNVSFKLLNIFKRTESWVIFAKYLTKNNYVQLQAQLIPNVPSKSLLSPFQIILAVVRTRKEGILSR